MPFGCLTHSSPANALSRAEFLPKTYDTIPSRLHRTGFDLCPDLATEEHRFNYSLFRTAVQAHPSRTEFLMADGDVIVFDNTRLLHGRTDFQHPVRHLVRVRMHERKHAEALRFASYLQDIGRALRPYRHRLRRNLGGPADFPAGAVRSALQGFPTHLMMLIGVLGVALLAES
jgi:hypothetical protein